MLSIWAPRKKRAITSMMQNTPGLMLLVGILAVGYVVCQSLCIRRKLFEIDNSHLDKWRTRLITNPKNQATQILSHLLLPQPKYILSGNKKNNETEDTAKVLIDNAPNVENAYGPLTAKETLEEAAKEFSSIHNSIIGNLELNFGSKAIEEERYNDAFEHFNNGAQFSSAGSMFNLALCYELGLGTSKDYSKAVQYYNQAADRGHPDAMYNLGVFHAQGKGGLKINLDIAHQLFTAAAQKGHSQAIKALQLEKSFKKRSNLEHNTKYSIQAKIMNSSLGTDRPVTKLTNYNSSMKSTYNQKYQFDQYLDSYNEHLEPKSSTDTFLEMLGIHERNAIPLISVGENGS
ncbi:uncharacterized protein LOC131670178 isoform X2 [Phymastichus coffea]|uniref:uncharacterized protein LOC131670178 isoform X2 n=1 Tax=Phymastichus coffea TaxID=108790 RepID=UPI00273AEEF0|nr:uncharacterized protein LOC131670178 isoform X2 [Phymastichus coffea]